jgi:hypothetical protein
MRETVHKDGFTITNLEADTRFQARKLHARDIPLQMEGMRRLGVAFVDSPTTILQVLVEIAVDLCGADSAGITIVLEPPTEDAYYQWIAVAGEYSNFLNATLPRTPNPCGVTLQRNSAQHIRVPKSLFDRIGSTASPITDGLLLPWSAGNVQGTVWITAHGRTEAFDREDAAMMKILAEFAAMAVRHGQEQRLLLERTNAAFASAMASELAHQINNPLQGLTNLMFLAAEGHGGDLRTLGQIASVDLLRLSLLVNKHLTLITSAKVTTLPHPVT